MSSPDEEELGDCIEKAKNLLQEWSGIAYRSTTPKYAKSADLLSGTGSAANGGRWNPPGLDAVYGSIAPETALAEVMGWYRRYKLPDSAAMPRVFVALDIDIQTCLDFTDAAVRRCLKLSRKVIVKDDWDAAQRSGVESLTQRIGRLCCERGIQGLLVPSARRRTGVNLVVFPKRLDGGCTLRVQGVNPDGGLLPG